MKQKKTCRRIWSVILGMVMVVGILMIADTANAQTVTRYEKMELGRELLFIERGDDVLSISWSTTNSGVARILSSNNQQADVRAVGNGTSTLTAVKTIKYEVWDITQKRYIGKTRTDTINWHIRVGTEPTDVYLWPKNWDMKVDDTLSLLPDVKPDGAATFYYYSSSNPDVAEVYPNGDVQAVGAGTATITVRTSNGITDTCSVTVRDPLAVSGTVPSDGSLEASSDQVIKITYNQNVVEGTGLSGITFTDDTVKKTIEASAEIDGKVLSITPNAHLDAGHAYTVELPAAMLNAADGSSFSATEKLSFAVRAVELKSDFGGRTDVGVNQAIAVMCGGKVQRGEQWENIFLVNSETEESVECIVESSGQMITVTPANPLDYMTQYTLTIPENAMVNGQTVRKHAKV